MKCHLVKIVVVFFISAITAGCKKDVSLPIEEVKLINILSDVHIAEAAMEGLTSAERDSLAQRYYQDIFTIHQVEQADFDTCLAILLRNPEQFGYIYEKVESNLEQRRLELGQKELPDEEE